MGQQRPKALPAATSTLFPCLTKRSSKKGLPKWVFIKEGATEASCVM